jgi:L-2-hydroxyglutarate oxidase LhgO
MTKEIIVCGDDYEHVLDFDAAEINYWVSGLAALSCTILGGEALDVAESSLANYFALSGKAPFSRLIYPIPEPGGTGVNLALDLGGQARFGPDVEWRDIDDERQIDYYEADKRRGAGFYASIRGYWSQLPDGALQPGCAGVRPKLGEPGEDADLRIKGPAAHGVPGLVNPFGIESPGLTASLMIARHVTGLLNET